MENIVVILILAGILGGAVWYIRRSRKKGKTCIGCPGGCSGCNGDHCKGGTAL